MNPESGRGTSVDLRARRASRDLRRSLSALLPHAHVDLERFERIRRRRQRSERRNVALVAAVVAAFGAFGLVRAFPPSDDTAARPTPGPGRGLIVFGRSATGLDERSLFVIEPDGSAERRLPITYTDCGEWSPDGSLLHITAKEFPGAPLRPAFVRADGSGFAFLDTSAPGELQLGCGDWSPDGDRLALEGFGGPSVDGIYSVATDDGSDLIRLTDHSDYVPQYAPDGTAIVFQRVDGGPHHRGTALFVMRSDGSNIHRVTAWGAAASSGSWGANGRIVFAGPHRSLWTVRSDGTDLTQIPVLLDGQPRQPRWSPDGVAIVFGLEVNGQSDIYTVEPDGSGLDQLTNTPRVDEVWPDWNVGSH